MSARTIRYRSKRIVMGLPLVSVACGPDLEHGESVGIAKGIIAIGDQAIGIVAIGGLAAGLISIGGLAIGLVTAVPPEA